VPRNRYEREVRQIVARRSASCDLTGLTIVASLANGGDDGGAGAVQWNSVFNRLACIGVVLILVFPLGRLIFPYIAHALGNLQFDVIEAVVTAALGSGLYVALFG
jgi:hypothetical protein